MTTAEKTARRKRILAGRDLAIVVVGAFVSAVALAAPEMAPALGKWGGVATVLLGGLNRAVEAYIRAAGLGED